MTEVFLDNQGLENHKSTLYVYYTVVYTAFPRVVPTATIISEHKKVQNLQEKNIGHDLLVGRCTTQPTAPFKTLCVKASCIYLNLKFRWGYYSRYRYYSRKYGSPSSLIETKILLLTL